MGQPIIEVDGKRYMDTKSASKLWGLKPGTVANYCKSGRIKGVFKDTSRRWCIPIDAIKPLSDKELRHLLTLTLMLKNNPSEKIDYSKLDVDTSRLPSVYEYLVFTSYIKEFDKNVPAHELPYKVQLTDKGMDIVLSNTNLSSVDFSKAVQKWSIVINLMMLLMDFLLSKQNL
jgi:hypothetical protein